jgi:hypothetical protein
LEIGETAVVAVLQMACIDYERVKGDTSIEMQIYVHWLLVASTDKIIDAPLRAQKRLKTLLSKTPGMRSASWDEKKAIGLRLLNDETARHAAVCEPLDRPRPVFMRASAHQA